MTKLYRSQPTGDIPAALREWCSWQFLMAELALNAAGPLARTPDGKRPTWLDYVGQARERPLIEAAMRANIWRSPVEIAPDLFDDAQSPCA